MKNSGGPLELWFREQLPDLWSEQSTKRQTRIKEVFVRVLLQDVNSQQLRQQLLEILKDDIRAVKEFRTLRQLWANSEFSNRYKLALLRYRRNNHYTFKSFGFSPISTVGELKAIRTSALRQAVKEARHLAVQPLSLRSQEAMVVRLVDDLRPRLYALSRRRLTFIVTSHNLSHDDMVSDLIWRVINSARWFYPFRDYQYMINSCYRAAFNYAINQIKWYTAEKRKRLVEDGGTGFYNREVAEQAEFLSNVAQDDPEERINNVILYEQLLESFGPGVNRNITILLLGLPEESLTNDFFQWSTEQSGQQIQDLDQLIKDNVHEEYIREFLNVNSFQVNAVKHLLRSKIDQYRDV